MITPFLQGEEKGPELEAQNMTYDRHDTAPIAQPEQTPKKRMSLLTTHPLNRQSNDSHAWIQCLIGIVYHRHLRLLGLYRQDTCRGHYLHTPQVLNGNTRLTDSPRLTLSTCLYCHTSIRKTVQ